MHGLYLQKCINATPTVLPNQASFLLPMHRTKAVGWKYHDRPFTGKSDHLCRMHCIATVRKKRPLCHGLMVLRSLLSLIHFFGNACD